MNQTQLNEYSINQTINLKNIISDLIHLGHEKKAGRLKVYTLKAMCDSRTPYDDMNTAQKIKFERGLLDAGGFREA